MPAVTKPSYVLALDSKGGWSCHALGGDADAALDAFEKLLSGDASAGLKYAELLIRGKITKRKHFRR